MSSKANTKGKNAKNVQVESQLESSSCLDQVCVPSQQEGWSVAQPDIVDRNAETTSQKFITEGWLFGFHAGKACIEDEVTGCFP